LHRLGGSLGDEIEQGPGGKLALTTVWLPDGAELEGVGSWRVIEADDREVIGDAQTEPPGGLQGTFSEPVRHAEKTSGSRGPGQECGGHGGALCDGAGSSGSNCYRRPVCPGADDRIAIAGQPSAGDGVGGCLLCCLVGDAADPGIVIGQGEHDQPVDDGAGDCGAVSLGRCRAGNEEQTAARLFCDGADPREHGDDDRVVEGVGERIVICEAKRADPAPAQAGGQRVRARVPEAGGGG
jgi:hypothetical protein